ncbi:adenylyl-sulfate kinase [Paenibacillus validus]|uniref:Adenylyl-sulfate kinase n=1 Tax=Paenibacillus validus TaxID=44253 RepID=A0A7X3CUX7_9BACL|nr:adenylyl-sulfate kinase [Paenibacillus validus]MUG73957.1 adenylyl-sulfate kinase [Paenibacillus validus]
MTSDSRNITWHQAVIGKADRHQLNQHGSCVLWLTGLSGSGKSSLAVSLERELFARNIRSYVLDCDNIRHGLNKNLGFSVEDRKENIRRIGEVAKLFVDAGLFTITAFISPFQEDRDMVRKLFNQDEFIEIHVSCSLEECEKRDPKGLYKKARNGEIKDFTGISSPYEVPANPELVIETDKLSIQESVDKIVEFLQNRKLIG